MAILEPGVTLTDYLLTLECAALSWLLCRLDSRGDGYRWWFIGFFCALGVAAFAGGTTHGFIDSLPLFVYKLLWNASLIAIGVGAVAAWMIGVTLALQAGVVARSIRIAIVAGFVAYCLMIVLVVNTFSVAIAFYLPATLFLLATFVWRYGRTREAYLMAGIVGLLLTFIGAGVQQSGLGLHPVWLDHNAIYHLIQALALLFLYRAARGLVLENRAELC